jgi:RNA polymerase sigma factor (sigma-70 family)
LRFAISEMVHHNGAMSDVTRILSQIDSGNPSAAEQLLPLVYDELRNLAAAKLAHEKPGQTLQATALVHEAYLRLVRPNDERERGREGEGETSVPLPLSQSPPLPLPNPSAETQSQVSPGFHSRGHFFAAAAEAMRRILVENARAKQRHKRGGDAQRVALEECAIAAPEPDERLLELDAALEKLAEKDPRKAELVKLRYFAGLTIEQAAEALGIGTSTADRDWSYARAWLFREMSKK